MLGISADKVVAAPLGVTGNFRPVQRNGDWLRDRFGIEGRFVLCVGTLEPRKNMVMALRAFERVAMREPDCELLVVGPAGWRNAAFERLLERTGASVHLTGFVSDDDLVALYSATDCFVYPSLAEGFGLPVAEALACGAPVVTSDRTSLPEVAGDAALLVDPENEEAVTDGILRVLTSPQLRRDLRQRALERARLFSWERCAEITAGAYAEVAGLSREGTASTRS
jgi:alpha-1,3-rhamnosyl/mannosyltransferase